VAISLRERLLGRFATLTNRFRVWYRLPFLLAMPTLVGQRVNMREHNLSDTERDPSLLKPQGGPSPRRSPITCRCRPATTGPLPT